MICPESQEVEDCWDWNPIGLPLKPMLLPVHPTACEKLEFDVIGLATHPRSAGGSRAQRVSGATLQYRQIACPPGPATGGANSSLVVA